MVVDEAQAVQHQQHAKVAGNDRQHPNEGKRQSEHPRVDAVAQPRVDRPHQRSGAQREVQQRQRSGPARFGGLWREAPYRSLAPMSITRMICIVTAPRTFSPSQAARRVIGLDTDVALREWTVWIPDLEPKHDGVRLGHLSDVHVGAVTPDRRIRNAVEILAAAQPDLFLLTGDFASRRPSPLARLGRLLDGLPPQSTFFVLGNHDHLVDAVAVTRALEGVGYMHLDNRHHTVELRGAPLHLIGLDDPVTSRHRPAQAVTGLPSEGTRVLLAHQAESVGEVLELGQHVDLCVSGHTHGGQIYVPRLTHKLMAKHGIRHVRGLQRYEAEGPWLHVTHGVGSAVTPLRVAARPEVALLTLRRDRSGVRFRG